MRAVRSAAIAAATASVLIAGCSSADSSASGGSSALQKVVWAQPGWNSLHIWGMVAVQQGFMRKNGVDLVVDDLQSPASGVPGLLSKSFDFVSESTEAAYEAQSMGANVKVVAIETDRSPFQLVVKPSVNSTSELGGINFAVNAPGNSLDWVAARVVMHKLGYSPSQYSFVTSGPPATQEAALASGVVGGSLNFPPGSTLAVQKGAHILLTVASESYGNAPRASAPIIADPAWYDAHRTAAVDFFKGMIEAMNFVYQPKNKATVVADIAKTEGISTTLATDTYNFFVTDIGAVSHDPAPTLEELENSLKDDQQAGLKGLPAPTAKALSGDYDDSLANDAENAMSGR